MQLSPEEAAQVIGIAQEIVSLESSPGWKHFVKAAEALAKTHRSKAQSLKGVDHTAEVASSLIFSNGIEACLGLIEQQRSILKSLTN